jgi:endonuclease/exonuclease/phosphatase family metal-dependent hydrolase
VLGAEAGTHQHRLLAQRLHALAPDVVCLQEARRPLVRRLRRALPDLGAATFVSKRCERRLPPWQEGLATLATTRPVRTAGHDLGAGRRVAVESVHHVGETVLHLFNVHLDTETVERARNVEALLALCAQRCAGGGVPVVVGDLNTKPRPAHHPDRAYDALRSGGFVDAVAELEPAAADPARCPGVAGSAPTLDECARCGYTNWHAARHPSERVGPPQQRLDYVLVPADGAVEVVAARTPTPADADFEGFRPISDHVPVVADLRLVTAGAAGGRPTPG